MKTKFTLIFTLAVLITATSLFIGCKKKSKEEEGPTLAGTPGNPRFNLQFPDGTKVDLDLHVLTPSGAEISYSNPFDDNGRLDVDCLCGDCPNGPNENIYWEAGSAPKGDYYFWVEYYDACVSGNPPSEFTLRLVKNSTILETYTGTLTPSNAKSAVYKYHFE